jgi:NAD(P)-dependent dehydrogenase (short-subunit alcohol dehydrogenase family)
LLPDKARARGTSLAVDKRSLRHLAPGPRHRSIGFDMRLERACALVTGGSSGLGLATTRSLLAAGAIVVQADLRPPSDGRATLGPDVLYVEADVTDESSLRCALSAAESFGGPLRALVHCAARGGDRARIVDREGRPGSLETFAEVLRVNLTGTYNVLRLAAATMAQADLMDSERGAIVMSASVAAFEGQIGQTAYAASKAGVVGMTLVAARDLAESQIRVNTIAPGTFDTPMLGRLPAEVQAALGASVPHPSRLGRPEEFGSLAVELLRNPYINGETVRIDGGIRVSPR